MKAVVGALVVCGVLVVAAPASATPCSNTAFVHDITVKNMRCQTAKRYITNWYHRGQPMPARFTCRLQSGVRSRCHYRRQAFTFRFAE
jgi:hypothetical protein